MPVTFFPGARERFFFIDLSIAIGVLLLFAVFRSWGDYVLLISWVLVFGYMMLMKRYEEVSHLLLATVISILWVHFAKEYYAYKHDFVIIFGMNSLPLMAWSLTLFGLYQVCNNYKFRNKAFNFLLFFLVFFVFGIVFETVAYHLLDIRNTMTSQFEGLPICDCVHAPRWMQWAYLALGPVYYVVTLVADGLIEKMTGIRDDLTTWTT
jgi:hypothetical protein